MSMPSNKKNILLFFGIVLFLFLAGCTASLQDYAGEDAPNAVTTVKYMGTVMKDCQETKCYCMVCENKTADDWFGKSVATLAGGSCSFRDDCTYDETNQTGVSKYLHDNKNAAIRPFMIGTGTTFSDLTYSDAFCRNGEDLAVKWLWGANGDPYPLPQAERATCLLEKNVIPVYVLYSEGKAVSSSRAAEVAARLNGAGPVILTTEMNFDKSKAAEVSQQAIVMKAACPNCLIAVAPKMGDVEALDAVMKSAAVRSIDLVAVGVDSDNYPFADCDPTRVMFYARNFSQYAMKTYSKPSIWPYIMIEEGKRNNADTCDWAENSTAMLNSFFFLTDLLPSLKNGVIGVAKYSYAPFVNPLNCSNCSEAWMPQTQQWSDNLVGSEPRFSQWYAFCSAYAGTTNGRANRVINVFPGQSDACQSCKYGVQNLNYYNSFTDSGGKSVYMTFTQKGNVQPIPADEINGWATPQDPANPTSPYLPYYKCNFCIANSTDVPEELTKGENKDGVIEDYGVEAGNEGLAECVGFPEIEFYSDKWEVDPLFIRAIINHESDFTPCTAVLVAKDAETYKKYGGDLKTGKSAVWNGLTVFPEEYDNWEPHTVPQGNIKAEGSKGDLSGLCPQYVELPEDLAYVAYGLGQTLEHPYWDWTVQPDGTLYTGGNATAEQLASYCFKDYNPFNATHAACRTAYEFKAHWDVAVNIVESHATQLGVDKPEKSELKRWYTAGIAYESYAGNFHSSWIDGYAAVMASESKLCTRPKILKDDKGKSVGEEAEKYGPVTSFIDYLANCQADLSGPCRYSESTDKVTCREYAKDILSKYYGLSKHCIDRSPLASSCPDSRIGDKNIK